MGNKAAVSTLHGLSVSLRTAYPYNLSVNLPSRVARILFKDATVAVLDPKTPEEEMFLLNDMINCQSTNHVWRDRRFVNFPALSDEDWRLLHATVDAVVSRARDAYFSMISILDPSSLASLLSGARPEAILNDVLQKVEKALAGQVIATGLPVTTIEYSWPIPAVPGALEESQYSVRLKVRDEGCECDVWKRLGTYSVRCGNSIAFCNSLGLMISTFASIIVGLRAMQGNPN